MNSTSEMRIENYLKTLRESLPNMSADDRDEIIREIRVHIQECDQEPGSSVESILERLGSAEILASQYSQDLLVRHASRSFSPLLILRATLHMARRGLEGTALFLGALFGYLLGGGLLVTAILKPIFSRQVGLWVGPGVFDFGFRELRYSDPVHEMLGWWYVPLAAGVGCIFLWLTTYGVRKFLKRSKQRGPTFARRSGIQANVASIMVIASLLAVGLSIGNPNRISRNRHDSSMTALREGFLRRAPRWRFQIDIDRPGSAGLHARFEFRRSPRPICDAGRESSVDCVDPTDVHGTI